MMKHSPSIVTAYTEGLVGRKVGAGEVNPYCKARQPDEYDAWLRGYYALGLHEGSVDYNQITDKLRLLEEGMEKISSSLDELKTLTRYR